MTREEKILLNANDAIVDGVLKVDHMRYTKDKLSANLLLLAIVLDALYFVKLYQQDVSSYFYNWEIGVSVVYNLVFMLSAFLCSEGVKNRRSGYTWMIVILGVLQFVRITQIPARAKDAVIMVGEEEIVVMSGGTHSFLVAMLAISGICILISAVTSMFNNKLVALYKQYFVKESA